jgi:hypothetical protein
MFRLPEFVNALEKYNTSEIDKKSINDLIVTLDDSGNPKTNLIEIKKDNIEIVNNLKELFKRMKDKSRSKYCTTKDIMTIITNLVIPPFGRNKGIFVQGDAEETFTKIYTILLGFLNLNDIFNASLSRTTTCEINKDYSNKYSISLKTN